MPDLKIHKNKMKVMSLLMALLMMASILSGCEGTETAAGVEPETIREAVETGEVVPEETVEEEIPEFSGEPYVELNHNEPYFEEQEITEESFEHYSSLDGLGRCGQAEACIGTDIMPEGERGSIGMVKPSGWHTVRYDDVVEGMYLYNRCHLIGYQLAGENANERNLITGTRYMNVQGMLPFENDVAEYVESTGNHVMYRVTPIYEGTDLVASGVVMEAFSVEDNGSGISFNVYVYNEQPGVTINHATGDSKLTSGAAAAEQDSNEKGKYIININSGKFHKPDCSGVAAMNEENKVKFNGKRQKLLDSGYSPCGLCNP